MIIGWKEDTTTIENGRTTNEPSETTLKKVIEMFGAINAAVEPTDISVIHQLPSRDGLVQPIIVMFSKRMAKVDRREEKE